jgi:hypothetical protein
MWSQSNVLLTGLTPALYLNEYVKFSLQYGQVNMFKLSAKYEDEYLILSFLLS